MTTIVSTSGKVCVRTDSTASRRSRQRSIANAAMITETVGEPVRSAGFQLNYDSLNTGPAIPRPPECTETCRRGRRQVTCRFHADSNGRIVGVT